MLKAITNCYNCKYFIKSKEHQTLSKCAKIKYTKEYEFAIISRDRKELCGPEAKFYEKVNK